MDQESTRGRHRGEVDRSAPRRRDPDRIWSRTPAVWLMVNVALVAGAVDAVIGSPSGAEVLVGVVLFLAGLASWIAFGRWVQSAAVDYHADRARRRRRPDQS